MCNWRASGVPKGTPRRRILPTVSVQMQCSERENTTTLSDWCKSPTTPRSVQPSPIHLIKKKHKRALLSLEDALSSRRGSTEFEPVVIRSGYGNHVPLGLCVSVLPWSLLRTLPLSLSSHSLLHTLLLLSLLNTHAFSLPLKHTHTHARNCKQQRKGG